MSNLDRALQSRDQAWAKLRELRDSIDRIAEEGPSRPEDADVLHRVVCVVSAELALRSTGDVQ